METAKVFTNGRSQAVRLPKEYRFDGDEVLVNKIGDVVCLIPKNKVEDVFLSSLGRVTDDFMAEGRNQGTQDERATL